MESKTNEARFRTALEMIDCGGAHPDPASKLARDALEAHKTAILLRDVCPHGIAKAKASDDEWVVLTEHEKWGFEDSVHEGDYISLDLLLGLCDQHAETTKALEATP
jgi:hypothetical protein